jgi:hypothetical protein
MTMLRELQTYLDAHHVPYEVLTHPIAYTAQEIARAQHTPGREMAKVVYKSLLYSALPHLGAALKSPNRPGRNAFICEERSRRHGAV